MKPTDHSAFHTTRATTINRIISHNINYAFFVWLFIWVLGVYSPASAEGPVRVAVSANFHFTAQKVAMAFTAETGSDVQLSFGSTGQLYAQILNGAPYHIFMAADTERPNKLVEAGLTANTHVRVYAIGKLALYTLDPATTPATLVGSRKNKRLAIANPATAPYGKAAMQFLSLIYGEIPQRGKLVFGNNVSQALQFVSTGNAHAGIVALAQKQQLSQPAGYWYEIDAGTYEPIKQGMVLLKSSNNLLIANDFFEFMQRKKAVDIIEQDGYGTPEGHQK